MGYEVDYNQADPFTIADLGVCGPSCPEHGCRGLHQRECMMKAELSSEDCWSNCLHENYGAAGTTNDSLRKAQMQSKQQDRLESFKRVSIQLTLSFPMLFLAIHFVTNAMSLILWLPSDLVDLLVCPLLLVICSMVNSFPNTLLWPGIGTVVGQTFSGSGRFKTAARNQRKAAPWSSLVTEVKLRMGRSYFVV